MSDQARSASLKAKINVGIVAYIIIAFSMWGWMIAERDEYQEALREAKRDARVEPASLFYKSIGVEPPPGSESRTRRVAERTPKPLILRVEDVVAIAVLGAFVGGGWLGLQLLAILFRNTLRMGASAITQGVAQAKSEADPQVAREDCHGEGVNHLDSPQEDPNIVAVEAPADKRS